MVRQLSVELLLAHIWDVAITISAQRSPRIVGKLGQAERNDLLLSDRITSTSWSRLNACHVYSMNKYRLHLLHSLPSLCYRVHSS